MGPNIDPYGTPQVMSLARIFHHLILCIAFYSLGSWKTTCCLILLFHKNIIYEARYHEWLIESKAFERSRNTPSVTSLVSLSFAFEISFSKFSIGVQVSVSNETRIDAYRKCCIFQRMMTVYYIPIFPLFLTRLLRY